MILGSVSCFVFDAQPMRNKLSLFYRVLKWECPRGGTNWGTLRIPREDWGTLGKIRGKKHPTLKSSLKGEGV